MTKVYSFDIFDTCLVRSCGRPDIVFDILAERLLGESASSTQKMDFAYERKKAESKARELFAIGEIEDITLEQIYSISDFSFCTDVNKNDILQLEKDIEKSVLRPVREMKDEIDELRKKGGNILFISDMYLDSTFLQEVLSSFNFYKEGDHLFVSSEIKLTKHSGNLYRFIAEKLGVSYLEWHHKGDNQYADVDVPRRMGIKADVYNNNYSYYQRQMACKDYTSQCFDAYKLASISRAVVCENDSSPYSLVAADFIAPIYVPFVYGIMKDANNRGIKNLFFLSRDGFIFKSIASVFQNLFPQISLHYLHVSRRSLYLPGLRELSIESISSLFPQIDSVDISDVEEFLKLECNKDSKSHLIGLKGKQLIKYLFDSPDLFKLLNELYNEQRLLSFEYFKQEGLCEPHSAIVDLGGTRRCHISINNILGENYNVFGYYFMVDKNRVKGTNYMSFHFKERFDNNPLNCTIEPQLLWENYFSITNHQRTIGYFRGIDGFVHPDFFDNQSNSSYCEKIAKINELVCAQFALHYMNIMNLSSCVLHCGMGLSVFSNFLLAPDKKYIKAFDQLLMTNSTVKIWPLLEQRKSMISHTQYKFWQKGNMVYNSIFPLLLTYLLRLELEMTQPFVYKIKDDSCFFDIMKKIRGYIRLRYRIKEHFIFLWRESDR